MRLFGQLADAAAPERNEAPGDAPAPPASPPDFRDLGSHVAEVLSSADRAAERIRTEAEEDAARVREEARAHAEAQVKAASDRRAEVEEEVQQRLENADERAQARIDAAEREAREMEAEAANRQDELRAETRELERQRDRALWEVRELASQLEEVLAEAPVSRERGKPFTQYTAPAHEADTVVEGSGPEDEDTLIESADGKSG